MDQLAQQLDCDRPAEVDLIAALDPGDVRDGAPGWQSLPPEILDRVLDPEA